MQFRKLSFVRVLILTMILSLLGIPPAQAAERPKAAFDISGNEDFEPDTAGTVSLSLTLDQAQELAADAPVRVVLGLTEDGQPIEPTDVTASWAGGEEVQLQTDAAGELMLPPVDAAAFTLADNPELAGDGVALEITLALPEGGYRLAAEAIAVTDGVQRLSGASRYETAVALSKLVDAPADRVYVARADKFPDALAGGPAAAGDGAPIVLTDPDSLPTVSADELSRLSPRQIVVLGGTKAVSQAVADQLAQFASDPAEPVVRMSGDTRFSTAAAIAMASFPAGVETAFVATGGNFPDALAGSAAAGFLGSPILLTEVDGLPAVTAEALSQLQPDRIVVLGGNAVVSDGVQAELANYTAGSVDRLFGPERYSTAAAIANAMFAAPVNEVFVATGENFPDALAAAAIAGERGAPLLLVPVEGIPDSIAQELLRLTPQRIWVVGGENVISATTMDLLRPYAAESAVESLGGTVVDLPVTDVGGEVTEPTPDPTEEPTDEPTEEPTDEPTEEPTDEPTEPTNTPPTVADIEDQAGEEGDTVEIQVQASDDDGDDLTYTLDGAPAGVTIDADSGLISGTIADGAAGDYTVTVTVSDGTDETTETFEFTVTEPATNTPPTVAPIEDQAGEEGDDVEIQVQASDDDGDDLTYTLDGAPAGVTIDADSGLISGTIADGAAGDYTVTVTVSDGTDSTDETFTFTVTPEACSPISSLTCPEVLVDQPVDLTFDGIEGGLVDGDGDDTGFTMVDPPSARLPVDGDPFNPDVPGYEPSLLNVDPTAGTLTIEATQGIQFKTNSSTTDTNSLINALGVGVDVSDMVTTVSTTLVNPDFDTSSNSEQGGLYFALDEDNLVKLVVVNQPGDNQKVQLQLEENGDVGDGDEMDSPTFLEGGDVTLTLVLDDSSNTATGSYSIAGGAPIPVGTLTIPQDFFDGELLPDGTTGPASYAGVFASKRRAPADQQVLVTFADFAVTSAAPSDNTAPEIILTGDRTLFENQELIIPVDTFDEDGDEVVVTVDGLPLAMTYTPDGSGGGDISGTVAQGAMTASPYTVDVTATDGQDTTTASFQIEVIDDIAVNVNFQSETADVPAGYLRDFGQPYAERTDAGQGDGLTYGWVAEGTEDPLSLVGNGRDRDRGATTPQELDTLIHMQYGDIATVYGGNTNCDTNQCAPGAWEIEVPDGLYEVTVSVGDQPGGSGVYDSVHAINVESGLAILAFQADPQEEYRQATAFAGVQDGRLTIDAIGGANTKINYVEIQSVGTRPMVTGVIPPNRATDVAGDTSISASVEVPGSGIGVDPDRDTSLTDEAVKLFEITDTGEEVEVAGNRGSTGGNDTIAFSPLEPLDPGTQYRYVIDGVLDEAGNTFGRFESTFTTGEDTGTGGGSETFTPVEGVNFEKVLLPTASGDDNGKFFTSLKVHEGYLWATTIGQGMYRYQILPDGTLGPEQDLNLLKGRAAIGLLFDNSDPDIAYVTHATANLSNEDARIGSKLSMIDFSDVADPVVTDLFINLPRSQKDHLSNSIAYGPSGDDDAAPWLYFLQGSNTAAGDTDSAWGNRGETQLTAALLRFDPQDVVAQVAASGPIDVATPEVGGSYDPYAQDAPLEIYATGIRNAYDLLWHSNGHLYVPTNGTAGGGNSPGVNDNGDTLTMTSASPLDAQTGFDQGTDVTDVCANRRIDGQPYTGGDVPAINGHPTQLDYLFDVEQGGYYGHPNPTRCEWVLNDGSDSPQNTGSDYPAGTEADPNYRGFAYNFDFNKSPNGVIEYMSPTFDGELQGRMMIVRFSGNDDILTMQVASDGEVLGAQPGTDIDGFTGYADPLELTEDTEVNPGNIYINQYNRGGEPQQLYLLRVPADQLSGGLAADPERLIMSATLNNEQPTDTDTITVRNTGEEPATVVAAVSGANAADFTVDTVGTVAAGEDAPVTITFDPTGTTTGTRTATVTFTSGEDTATVEVRALAFEGQEGGQEPSLQQVADTYELGIDTGWDGLADGTGSEAKGDEVLEPLFQRASDGPVTMTPIAAFAPQEVLPFGYYTDDGGTAVTTQVGALADGQLQTLDPALASGGTTFDPGDATFGLYYFSNTFNRTGYTEDARNDSGVHRARIYPLAGDDRYLVAFEDAFNGDYQDYVFILDNVVPADDPGSGGGGEPTGDAIQINFQSETTAVPDGYLRDYGQAYGPRSGTDQGDGLTYGWVDDETFAPLSLVGNGRDRNSNDNQLLDTLMHMDLPPDSQGGTLADGSWQVAVADGDYEVTVTVGDPNNGGAPESHTINVEGVNAIDGFPKSTAPNGSDARHMTATVTVEVADGALTIDQIGGENTKINYVDIVPVGAQPDQTVAQVNFQPAPSPTPTDWVADSGELFSTSRGYGWVRTEGGAPKTGDTRDRTQDSDPLNGTLIIVDDATVAAVVDGEWEYALPDGEYIVEASVGDAGFADSTHSVTAEGTTVVGPFTPSAPGDYQTGSAAVSVEDGALTLASSGSNTKLQWVRILSTADGDVVPPQVTIDLDGDGSNGTYTGPVTVTVTATDRTLEFTEYTVDGGGSQNYTGPFEVTGTGDHVVEVTATDGAGNSTVKSAEFTIVQLNNGDLTVTNPEAAPFNDRLVMSRIESDVDSPSTKETATVVLGNSGSDPVQVLSLSITGDGFELVDPPTVPFSIGVGEQQPVVVKFVGVGSGDNQLFEDDLVITHDGADGPTATVELAGIWQVQEEGGNEPTLTQISAAYGLGTTIVGQGQQLNNEGRLESIGDEVLSQTWTLVDESEPATVRQLAAYHTCCNNTAAFGWHPPGNKDSFTQVVRHDGQWAQSLLPRINNSDTQPAFTSFNPAPDNFSFRIDPESSDWTLNNTAPDDCNPTGGNQGDKNCQLGHHLRVWPAEDRDGNAIPGTYLVAMDYSGINYDFNDNVYLVTNVVPSS